MKRLFSVAIILLLMLAAVPLGVFAATSVSPSGGKVSGTFNDDAQDKDYEIKLSSAGRLTFNIDTGLDFEFRLYDGTSSDYSNYDYESIDKGSESLTYDLTPGTYTVRLSNGYGDYGSFGFTTSFTPANETYTAENNTINAVRNGASIPFKSTITGQMAWNDEDDYYKVVLPSSGRIKLSVHNDIEKVSIYLYDSKENIVNTIDSGMEKGDNSYIYDLTAGTYFIRFSRYWTDDTGLYNYNLIFTPSGETYKYANDTINAVRGKATIPLAKEIKGQIAYNDEYDFYKIVIPVKANYFIALNSKIDNFEMRMYDAKENSIEAKDGSYYFNHTRGKKTYVYSLKKGTYYLRFSRNYNDEVTGNYSFKLGVSVAKPKIVKPAAAKKALTVKWKKVSGATGYKVQYSLNSKFKNAKTITIKKGTAQSKKIKKLKAKKKYFVRVRAYKTVKGKNYYSKWSTMKVVKTK